jgi:hypothetical protein
LSATLSNWHDHWLVIGGADQSTDAIETSGETPVDSGLEKSIAVASIINTFEEGKVGRVGRAVGAKRSAKVLHSEVTVTNNVTIAVEILGSSVVSGRGIGKDTGSEMYSLDS